MRGAGTFAGVLGQYSRETQLLPLMDALAKMTILPARAHYAPEHRRTVNFTLP
jgi:N-acyl-D-aspartate/D-glutamate deacylase